MICMTMPSSAAPVRGEVWWIRFDPSVGAEIQKLRPAVVVSTPAVGRLPLRIVVPITDWKPAYAGFPWFVSLAASTQNGLSKDSGADAFQAKSVALGRFEQRLGTLSAEETDKIAAAIALCVGYVPPAAP
jgi:mRNA interferase MazF